MNSNKNLSSGIELAPDLEKKLSSLFKKKYIKDVIKEWNWLSEEVLQENGVGRLGGTNLILDSNNKMNAIKLLPNVTFDEIYNLFCNHYKIYVCSSMVASDGELINEYLYNVFIKDPSIVSNIEWGFNHEILYPLNKKISIQNPFPVRCSRFRD